MPPMPAASSARNRSTFKFGVTCIVQCDVICHLSLTLGDWPYSKENNGLPCFVLVGIFLANIPSASQGVLLLAKEIYS